MGVPVGLHFELIVRNGEGFPVNGKREGPGQHTEQQSGSPRLHREDLDLSAFCPARRWRATSYITTAPATETFSDGTCPSIGIDTRKSQRLRTRSCSPLPSAPSTTAQCMLKSS